jgi:hypothetical protein
MQGKGSLKSSDVMDTLEHMNNLRLDFEVNHPHEIFFDQPGVLDMMQEIEDGMFACGMDPSNPFKGQADDRQSASTREDDDFMEKMHEIRVQMPECEDQRGEFLRQPGIMEKLEELADGMHARGIGPDFLFEERSGASPCASSASYCGD